MGEINLTDRQINALKAIDEHELRELIDDAIQQERPSQALQQLPFMDCGVYVGTQRSYFWDSLKRYREAKSAKKREQTEYDVQRAGRDFLFSFQQMKHRMKEEEKNRLLFFVDDQIFFPHRFTKDLSVTASYRFRKTTSDEWTFGRITFQHRFVPPISHLPTQPKRKPSAAKQDEILQEELSLAWQHFTRSALWAVREFFVDGGDGNNIPDRFTAVIDNRGQLNNYSLRFWSNGNENA